MKFYGYEIDTKKLPTHIGIIMDGNGRWAKKQGMRRIEGHKKGFESLIKIIRSNKKLGVKYITVYAFSTENWSRPVQEVSFLMGFAKKILLEYIHEFLDNDIRLRVTGTSDRINPELQKLIEESLEKTKHCKSYTFNIAFNYGGQREIVDATKKIIADYEAGKLKLNKLDEKKFADYLYQPDIPPLDMVIRTSGELRLSNFLLWQSAYSEFWFTKKLWPNFSPRDFHKAVYDFQNRKRRFGKL